MQVCSVFACGVNSDTQLESSPAAEFSTPSLCFISAYVPLDLIMVFRHQSQVSQGASGVGRHQRM